jgi:hypothetical protein
MVESSQNGRWRGAQPIGALIGGVIEPVCAKRGFASADLLGAWDEIVGARYAGTTQPEKILWPRRDSASSAGATLVVRVDAGMAIYLQHETALVLERVNAFLGFAAIRALKIVQGPVEGRQKPASRTEAPVSATAVAVIRDSVAPIESDALRQSLERLGRCIYGEVERS